MEVLREFWYCRSPPLKRKGDNHITEAITTALMHLGEQESRTFWTVPLLKMDVYTFA